MGVTRKFLSASTLGLIDYRSDKERIARSARLTRRAVESQTRELRRRSAVDAAYAPAPVQSGPPPGWYVDPQAASLMRWWDGQRWTEHTQLRA